MSSRGVKAFRRPIASYSQSLVRSVTLTRDGRQLRGVSYHGGPWELYTIDADSGLERFAGYASEALSRLIQSRRQP